MSCNTHGPFITDGCWPLFWTGVMEWAKGKKVMKERSVCKNTLVFLRDFGCEFLFTEDCFPPTWSVTPNKVTILLYIALTSASCSSHYNDEHPDIIKKRMLAFKMLPGVKGEERSSPGEKFQNFSWISCGFWWSGFFSSQNSATFFPCLNFALISTSYMMQWWGFYFSSFVNIKETL